MKTKKVVVKAKKVNPWISHVKKCKAMKENEGKSLKEVLKKASTTYKK